MNLKPPTPGRGNATILRHPRKEGNKGLEGDVYGLSLVVISLVLYKIFIVLKYRTIVFGFFDESTIFFVFFQ